MNLIRIGNECDDSVKAHIIDTLGHHVWEPMKESLGGQDLMVPVNSSTLHDEHYLVLAIGFENAVALVEQFAGERIYIRRDAAPGVQRYVVAVQAGLTNRAIAKEFGVTERQVRRALSSLNMTNPDREPKTRRTGLRLSAEELARRGRIVSLYLEGEIETREAAASRLGIAPETFSTLISSGRYGHSASTATHARNTSSVRRADTRSSRHFTS
ncbi:hypothetical protein FB480_101224 [Agrobacterium vitis]|nr:hypothetical protein FB480_101224 [Agrobacterium vitis]